MQGIINAFLIIVCVISMVYGMYIAYVNDMVLLACKTLGVGVLLIAIGVFVMYVIGLRKP